MALKDHISLVKNRDSGFRGNINIRSSGVLVPLTEEHIEEIRKCYEDPIYFIKNYVKIVTLDDGVQLFNIRPYQEEWIRACANNRFVIGKWSRQSGKCVSGNAQIKVRNSKTGQILELSIEDFYRFLGRV